MSSLCPCTPPDILNLLNIQSALSLSIAASLTVLCLAGDHGDPSSLSNTFHPLLHSNVFLLSKGPLKSGSFKTTQISTP